eukprot:gene10242-13768_t
MKLSFFMMPMHNLNRDYHTTLEEDIEAVKFADELGFEEFFMGEHYTCEIEQVSSPMMFLAYIAKQTKTIKLGTGVLPLPLYHPVMAASHIALLDHLTEGRLILGVGTGALGSDFEASSSQVANNRKGSALSVNWPRNCRLSRIAHHFDSRPVGTFLSSCLRAATPCALLLLAGCGAGGFSLEKAEVDRSIVTGSIAKTATPDTADAGMASDQETIRNAASS